jgi:hypothetical protein
MNLKLVLVSVIYLAIFEGCALLNLEPNQEQQDPIARAALAERKPALSAPQSNEESPQFNPSYEIQDAIESGHLVVGMKMMDVLSVWGRPRDIESAGDPNLGHQKWTYSDSLFQHMQLKPSRVVYFESGRVIGWETAD